jgi:prevent-host-death family protein
MREIPVSKFKATCLATVAEVQRTKRPVRLTRFGKPVADIVPAKEVKKRPLLGAARGMMEIRGDIVNTRDLWAHWDVREK